MSPDSAHVDSEHAERSRDLGAYLLGSLAPAERAGVDRHLAGCALCRAELAALAPLPGLLGRLTAEEARRIRDGLAGPPDDLVRRTVEAVHEERRRERRRLFGWRLATVAATLVAVVGIGTLLVPDLVGGAPGEPFVAAAGVSASGNGTLQARTWGTALQLELAGLPAAPSYQAFATARDGHTEVAASWGATPSGRAVVAGATAIQRTDLVAVEVRTADGTPLLTLPC